MDHNYFFWSKILFTRPHIFNLNVYFSKYVTSFFRFIFVRNETPSLPWFAVVKVGPKSVKRWPNRIKNDDIHEKFIFLKNIIFKTILLNLPGDEYKIQGKYTVMKLFLHSNVHRHGYLQ